MNRCSIMSGYYDDLLLFVGKLVTFINIHHVSDLRMLCTHIYNNDEVFTNNCITLIMIYIVTL